MLCLHNLARLCMSCDSVCRGASSLVHYWYHPDSYDRCLPAEVAPEVVEPDKRIRGKRLFLHPCFSLWQGLLVHALSSLHAMIEIRYIDAVHLIAFGNTLTDAARDTLLCRSVEGEPALGAGL